MISLTLNSQRDDQRTTVAKRSRSCEWKYPSRTSSDLEILKVVTDAVYHAHGKTLLVQPSMLVLLPDYVRTGDFLDNILHHHDVG